jgi:hypothetical protein
MNYTEIIIGLSQNRDVFNDMLPNLSGDIVLWKPAPEKWCLLEIVCHLYDEEREDFRARTKHVLETPAEPLPSIDPQGWVTARNYIQQDYQDKLNQFLNEREASVKWLTGLSHPQWDNAYIHPKFGSMTAKMFLSNWLAHDYLHIRQITKLKYDYLKHLTGESLSYAGEW